MTHPSGHLNPALCLRAVASRGVPLPRLDGNRNKKERRLPLEASELCVLFLYSPCPWAQLSPLDLGCRQPLTSVSWPGALTPLGTVS